jgi:uncharacterized damage-inducible protein DinB
MNLSQPLIAELDHEAFITRRVLERVPFERFDFKPHPKSMSAGRLASHVAELFGWGKMTLETEELVMDPSKYSPWTAGSTAELLEKFDSGVADFKAALGKASAADLMVLWRFRTPERVIFELPRLAVLRSMVFSHLIHHRGQLSVFLRLLDVPVPSIYGPSADERS